MITDNRVDNFYIEMTTHRSEQWVLLIEHHVVWRIERMKIDYEQTCA